MKSFVRKFVFVTAVSLFCCFSTRAQSSCACKTAPPDGKPHCDGGIAVCGTGTSPACERSCITVNGIQALDVAASALSGVLKHSFTAEDLRSSSDPAEKAISALLSSGGTTEVAVSFMDSSVKGTFGIPSDVAAKLREALRLLSSSARSTPQTSEPTPCPTPENARPNGISVGRPKVFDNRTLTIMLEGLSESLRNMQFVDQKTLAAAFNMVQGFSSRETVRSLSVSPLPLPGLKQETITATGNATEAGTPLPDTTKQTTTSDRAAYTPQAPALDTVPAFSGYNPTYGENPSDLLNNQVNLTYQIFNLRMILERSLSDRLLSGTSDKPRRQAVLGFNVTLDPPRAAEDAVAVVKITVDLPDASAATDGLSLVALMPQEKVYNSAALSTKSNAFAGSAVVKMFQVGYSERRRGQVFYLYGDTDTVSFEQMNNGNPKQLVFGWMFRPVLGRRSISPGFRQLFAIVSLPTDDSDSNEQAQLLNSKVETYWKKYDRDTMTSFEVADANRASRVKYAVSFNLSKPEIFNSRYRNWATYNGIEVKSTSKYQGGLVPQIDNVWWVPIGTKMALLSITGNNFFTGTQVTMGDKVYTTPADGLTIKSNQAMDVITTLDALAAGPGAIIGRYGPAVPIPAIEAKTAGATTAPTTTGGSVTGATSGGGATSGATTSPDGIKIGSIRLGASLSGSRSLEIDLLALTGGSLKLSDLPKDPKMGQLSPIVTINGAVAPLPYTLVEKVVQTPVTGGPTNYLTLQTNIADALLSNGGGVIKVSWPFRNKWTATSQIYDPTLTYRAIRLGANRIVLTTTDPLGFRSVSADPCWMLLAGDKTISLPSSSCTATASGAVKLSDFAVDVTLADAAPDKVILVSPEKFTYSLDVPKAASAEPAGPKPIELKQYDAVWIEMAVKDVSKVVSVEANQLTLRFKKMPDKDGKPAKSIRVQIIRALTAQPGDVDITALDKDGNSVGEARLHISPCENCNDKGGK